MVEDKRYAWFLAPSADGKRLMIIRTVYCIEFPMANNLLTFPTLLMGLTYDVILLLPPTSLSRTPALLDLQVS